MAKIAVRTPSCCRPLAWRGITFTLLGAGLLIQCSAASAQSTIYRCVKDGRVTLTDQPCDGKPTTPVLGPVPSGGTQPGAKRGPPDSPVGTWHGAVAAELTVAGKPVTINPPLGALTFQISADNTVSGSFQNDTCVLAGKVTGDYSLGDRALDVTVTHCTPTQLNMRFTGDIRIGAVGEPAHLALSGLSGFIQGKSESTASLKGDLMRDDKAKTARDR